MSDSLEPRPPEPLRSIHTTSFAEILESLGISLLVTTYQAGKLVILRSEQGCINTHFRTLNKPMGLAVRRDRVAVGTAAEIWEFHNMPAVCRRLKPAGKHDACFMPRNCHVTGDVQIHEMAWGETSSFNREPQACASDLVRPSDARACGLRLNEPELWFVNTRFSCLCTRDAEYSFVPRWRPPFITALTPEDRCHLNGVGLVEGWPRYVTAHGSSDAPAGWREDKAHGGILMDVPSGEIILSGLSMPHSPRWYADRLWLLDSGSGSIGVVDRQAGRYQPVAELPGFPRGLDFFGRYAFVGLSQVRESAVFSGIAIASRPLEERTCGVWVLDIHTGQIVAYLKFEEAVQEVFAVQVLPGVRFPDVINDDQSLITESFVLPDEALDDVPDAIRYRVP